MKVDIKRLVFYFDLKQQIEPLYVILKYTYTHKIADIIIIIIKYKNTNKDN